MSAASLLIVHITAAAASTVASAPAGLFASSCNMTWEGSSDVVLPSVIWHVDVHPVDRLLLVIVDMAVSVIVSC